MEKPKTGFTDRRVNLDFKKIEEIKGEEKNLSLKIKLINVEKRTTKSDKGENVYHYGLLGDETGTMFFTAWSFNPNVQAGDVLELKNCYTKEFNGTLRLYLDNRSEIILLPEEKMEVKRSFKEAKIKDLSTRDPYVTVQGIISDVRSREYERDGETRKVYFGDIADETGKVRVSSFGRSLPEGTGVKIEGAKVSEYKGRLRISVNEKTKIGEVNVAPPPGRRLYNISDLGSPVGGVSFSGFIISLGEKSGLRLRCSECRKTIEDVRCPDHPSAPFIYDLFAYFTLSDGTGYIQCTSGREALMKLLGMQESDLDPASSSLTKREVYSSIRKELHGKPFILEGDLAEGNNGLSLRVSDISRISRDDVKSFIREMEVEL